MVFREVKMDKDYAKKVVQPPKFPKKLDINVDKIFDEDEKKLLMTMSPEARVGKIKTKIVEYAKKKGVSLEQLKKSDGMHKLSLNGEKITSNSLSRLSYITNKCEDKIRTEYAKSVGLTNQKEISCYFSFNDAFKSQVAREKSMQSKWNLIKIYNTNQLLSQGYTQEFLEMPLKKLYQVMGVTPKTRPDSKKLDTKFIDFVCYDTLRLSRAWHKGKDNKPQETLEGSPNDKGRVKPVVSSGKLSAAVVKPTIGMGGENFTVERRLKESIHRVENSKAPITAEDGEKIVKSNSTTENGVAAEEDPDVLLQMQKMLTRNPYDD